MQSLVKLNCTPVNLHPWYTEESMRLYCLNNETCRRRALLKDFDVDYEVVSPSCLCVVMFVLSLVIVTFVQYEEIKLVLHNY